MGQTHLSSPPGAGTNFPAAFLGSLILRHDSMVASPHRQQCCGSVCVVPHVGANTHRVLWCAGCVRREPHRLHSHPVDRRERTSDLSIRVSMFGLFVSTTLDL
eukprot:TRINITY_DN6155_c1_g2_i5.p2 TRINITY_DN6155_c1_g2~~TRINITY_DN6155_c1_g2_i5.p2  ORF type:complete len:103 (-),score=1.89 TRINITY_DN6155_c1_g2_i5:4-312(-)